MSNQPAQRPQRIVVLYENSQAREYALDFCERRTRECHPEPSPELHWFSFGSLTDPTVAYNAIERASVADLLVFAIVSAGDFAPGTKLWIERWLMRHTAREGVMVGLVADRPVLPGEMACLKEVYLRHTAHRAGMDYLSQELPAVHQRIPDSIESYNDRAGRVTSVLDQILHKHPASPSRIRS